MGNIINRSNCFLITGVSGFIGYYLAERLLLQGHTILGIDNMNSYYEYSIKQTRLNKLKENSRFIFEKENIANKQKILSIFKEYQPDVVINLAAQAGVRYSIKHPDIYMESNIIGFYNILEACRHYPVKHLIYASSSSVYGANKKVPFEETDFVDHPVSLYAASKKSNELMGYTYSHLYGIPATGLRFFTVYGPLGRPDMAYFGFTDKYFNNEPIKIFNNGDLENDLYRDFTYIDDIITGIERLINKSPDKEDDVPHRVFNIGNNNPVKLMTFITALEKALGNALGREVEFNKVYEPMKSGDVPATYASTDFLHETIGFKPETSIEDGLREFANWYVDYYKRY